MRDSTLPVEFLALSGRVSSIVRVSSTEWSSSCPQCGGVPHKDGSYPDRFRMWTNAHGKNKVMGWCRQCSFVFFATSEKPMTPVEFESWRKHQIAVEQERKLEAEIAIKSLQSKKVWEYYHKQLNAWVLEDVLPGWGLNKEYADYWELGLISDYVVKGKEAYHSPAITIPVWRPEKKVGNVKVRVLNPKSSNDRYRSLYKIGRDLLFFAWPDKRSDVCLVVEGEKKAMVCAAFSDQTFQVVGLPSATPSPESLRDLKDYGTILLCLDPDARKKDDRGFSAFGRVVDLLGKERVAVINLADKVDDMIVYHGLEIMSALKNARKVEHAKNINQRQDSYSNPG